jgi:hypothetical protein
MYFNQPADLRFGATATRRPNQDEIRVLPQFYRADYDMVYRRGGLLLRQTLEAMPLAGTFKHISIDSRTHMLMPRMYPCIPGWHCDDFFRPTGDQPDLVNVSALAPSVHHSVIFGNNSLTEFIVEPLELPDPSRLVNVEGQPVYGVYDRMIENLRPEKRWVQEGEIVTFGPLVFHRGVPATAPGWRYFLRVTESNHWEPRNEIRTQSQVYLTEDFYSW